MSFEYLEAIPLQLKEFQCNCGSELKEKAAMKLYYWNEWVLDRLSDDLFKNQSLSEEEKEDKSLKIQELEDSLEEFLEYFKKKNMQLRDTRKLGISL